LEILNSREEIKPINIGYIKINFADIKNNFEDYNYVLEINI